MKYEWIQIGMMRRVGLSIKTSYLPNSPGSLSVYEV